MRTFALIAACVFLTSAGSGAWADEPKEPIVGPMLLCFMHSTFQLADGERVTDVSLGIHAMSVDVTGPRGRYSVSEGNHFAQPGRLGPSVHEAKTFSAHRVRRDEAVKFAVVGTADFAPNEPRVLLWIAGPALAGAYRERIFRRLTVRDPAGSGCRMAFRYGWNLED